MMSIELKSLDSISEEKLTDMIYTVFPEKHCHWDYQCEVKESMKNLVPHTSAVAWRDDEAVGAVICSDKNGVHIDHIGVLPNHQRMGVGRMLLRHAVDNAEENITTEVPKDNHATVELLEEEGFERKEEKEDHFIYRYTFD